MSNKTHLKMSKVQLKKYLPYLIIFILAFYSFDLSQRYNSLERSKERLEDSVLDEIAKNEDLLKKLQKVDFNTEAKEEKIKELLEIIDSLQNQPYDTSIDTITDADRISELFSKYYPNNN